MTWPVMCGQPIEGVYCGVAWSGGRQVEVRTKLAAKPDGLLSGVYEFADNGETTAGELQESYIQSDRTRTLAWRDKYGSGLATFSFDEKGDAFTGLWGAYMAKPSFQWDGKRCDTPAV